MRGDGPVSLAASSASLGFPPHARGWTLRPRCSALCEVVSPACAGMDLLSPDPLRAFPSFPRMRGDGP